MPTLPIFSLAHTRAKEVIDFMGLHSGTPFSAHPAAPIPAWSAETIQTDDNVSRLPKKNEEAKTCEICFVSVFRRGDTIL